MIGWYFDTMIVASSDKEWLLMTHQNLTAGNCLDSAETLLGVNSDKRHGLEMATWELWIGDEWQTTPAK